MNIILVLVILFLLIIIYLEYMKKLKEEYFTKIMWIYWHDLNDCPEIVKNNLKYLQQSFADWSINILTQDNIENYIPQTIIDLAKDTYISHQADLYRLYLIMYYGGLWLDASILIKDITFINNLYNICLNTKKIALFEIYDKNNVSKFPVLESWFIMSPIPNNPIITMWYNQYVDALTLGFTKYIKEIQNIVDISHIYKSRGEYLVISMCLQYIVQTNPHLLNEIIIYKSEDSMLKIQTELNWNFTHFKDYFLKIGNMLPFIKLCRNEREILKDLDVEQFYSNN